MKIICNDAKGYELKDTKTLKIFYTEKCTTMIKRGQVTIFIVVGIILVLIVALYISFLSEQTPRVQRTDGGFESVELYVESVLNSYSQRALEIVGERGGYIGSFDMLSFPFKHEYEATGKEIAVAIRKIPEYRNNTMIEGGHILAKNPPEETPPYKIGWPLLIDLQKTTYSRATNIKQEMEEYIEEGIKDADIPEQFKQQFDIKTEEKPNVSVSFSNNKTTIKLDYSMNITDRGTGNMKPMDKFDVEMPIDFRRFFLFIESAIDTDTTYSFFRIDDISSYQQLTPYYKEEKYKINSIDVDDDFELLTFTYNQTGGQEYRFRVFKEKFE